MRLYDKIKNYLKVKRFQIGESLGRFDSQAVEKTEWLRGVSYQLCKADEVLCSGIKDFIRELADLKRKFYAAKSSAFEKGRCEVVDELIDILLEHLEETIL